MDTEMEDMVQKLRNTGIGDKGNENRHLRDGQNFRRSRIMEDQESYNTRHLNKSRFIALLVESIEGRKVRTKKDKWKPSVVLPGFLYAADYCNTVSHAEWLLEKPDDFWHEWVVVACPKAMRMMVVAYKGKTNFFDKYGYLKFECKTLLPGGNFYDKTSDINPISVLDCFYSKENDTMYMLDILCFNKNSMAYMELRYRQQLLETNIVSIAGLDQHSDINQKKFKILHKTPCTPESLMEILGTFSYFPCNRPAVDGLMFFHIRGLYFSGETPLVLWIYMHMVPEVLGHNFYLHPRYLEQKTMDYVNNVEFIKKFESQPKRMRQRRALTKVPTWDLNGALAVEGNKVTEVVRAAVAAAMLPCSHDYHDFGGTQNAAAMEAMAAGFKFDESVYAEPQNAAAVEAMVAGFKFDESVYAEPQNAAAVEAMVAGLKFDEKVYAEAQREASAAAAMAAEFMVDDTDYAESQRLDIAAGPSTAASTSSSRVLGDDQFSPMDSDNFGSFEQGHQAAMAPPKSEENRKRKREGRGPRKS